MGWLGMIDPLALELDRASEARACLERVKSLPMNPMMQKGLLYPEGMVLLAERKYSEARARFEAVLPWIKKQETFSPNARGLQVMARAQLAIAFAKLGDHEAALAHFTFARRFLELHKINTLLSRCKRELGIG